MRRYVRAVTGVVATQVDGTEISLDAFNGRAIKRTQYHKDIDRIEVVIDFERPGMRNTVLYMTPQAYHQVKVDGPTVSATTGDPNGSH